MRDRCVLAMVLLVSFGVAGCATTQPWERETLSREVMSMDGDPDSVALRHHVLSVREGTPGGLGGGGGGCGCN
jgi:hypothetical protein